MRIAVSFVTLALIIVGSVLVWRSGEVKLGVTLILLGLAINTIMAASRHWFQTREMER